MKKIKILDAEIGGKVDEEDFELEGLKKQKEELAEEKKKVAKGSDRLLVWSIIFIVVILALIFAAGYLVKTRESYETVTYNNFEFTNIGGMWFFEWQDDEKLFTVPLRFNPFEVEDIKTQGRLNSSFNRETVYITFDPDSKDMTYLALGATELAVNMARAINVKPVAACTKNSSNGTEFDFCIDRPILSCETGKSVIYLKTSEEPRILVKGECIVLEGKGFELLRAIDRLLYQWYGIME